MLTSSIEIDIIMYIRNNRFQKFEYIKELIKIDQNLPV